MQTLQTVQQQQQQAPMDGGGVKQPAAAAAVSSSQQSPATSVLRVIVENMCYQITVDTLRQVRSHITRPISHQKLK